ncbi:MAG: hypothetical protein V1694_11340 [Candidatus Eisenbacteria bacterium]
MNKPWLVVVVAVLVLTTSVAFAQRSKDNDVGDRQRPHPRPMIIDNTSFIDANNIQMIVTNHGSFAYDLTAQNSGLWFPKGTDKTAVYASGLWIGAKVGGETRIAAGSFAQEYGPGPILEDGTPDDPSKPEHRVYKIRTGDNAENSTDYAEWPSDLGAPVDEHGNPLLLGDQTLWCVYNDADPALHNTDEGRTKPLGVEVQQTTFAFDWKGALGNVIFIKFKVINKGENLLENTYFSVWADPDVGGSSDDYVGCDTTLNVGFAYNATNTDNLYGARVPCVGYDFFLGPVIKDAHGVPIDTLGMSSFNKYINGTDPRAFRESYNYMQGLTLDGKPVLDPLGNPTKFWLPGDPVTNTGWLDSDPADRRFMVNSGPFTMAPGDTQQVVVGIIVGQGNDRIGSVRVMKFYDQTAQVAFDLDFDLPKPPARPAVTAVPLDGEVRLTWGTDSEDNPGTVPYAFEGYNVYQSASVSAAGPWTLVAVYDRVNKIQTIEDTDLNIDFGLPLVQPVQFGKDAGLSRFIELVDDKVNGVPLSNGTTYFYRVGAYSYNPNPLPGLPKTLESQSAILPIIPQEPVAGKVLSGSVDDVEHHVTSGAASHELLDVAVADPFALTGHDYKIIYERSQPADLLMMLGDMVPYSFDYHWKLIDVTDNNAVLFDYGINRNADDDYPVIDGIVPRVRLRVPIGRFEFRDAAGDLSGVLTGCSVGLPYALNDEGGEGVGYGQDLLGSTVRIATSFDKFPNCEVRFDDLGGETQMAYRYLRWFDDQDNLHYDYQDFVEVPFTVWDTDHNKQLDACFVEYRTAGGTTEDGKWMPDASARGGREWLFINPTPYQTDSLVYGNPADPINPRPRGIDTNPIYAFYLRRSSSSAVIEPGSKLIAIKAVPSTDKDYFTFSTTPPGYDGDRAKSALADIRVVPNPYFAKSSYEIDQFHHIVKFSNLPSRCTIRVFNLAGDLVRTLDKDDSSTSVMEWDLYNEVQIPIASGLYIYHVDAPGIGSTFGKMAIFLEKERLNTF